MRVPTGRVCRVGLVRRDLHRRFELGPLRHLPDHLRLPYAQLEQTLFKVDRFLASSQTCSACWAIDGPKPLHVRTWTCSGCGTIHDRDINASRIVLAAGRKLAREREAES